MLSPGIFFSNHEKKNMKEIYKTINFSSAFIFQNAEVCFYEVLIRNMKLIIIAYFHIFSED